MVWTKSFRRWVKKQDNVVKYQFLVQSNKFGPFQNHFGPIEEPGIIWTLEFPRIFLGLLVFYYKFCSVHLWILKHDIIQWSLNVLFDFICNHLFMGFYFVDIHQNDWYLVKSRIVTPKTHFEIFWHLLLFNFDLSFVKFSQFDCK